jgi:hypothetical protein
VVEEEVKVLVAADEQAEQAQPVAAGLLQKRHSLLEVPLELLALVLLVLMQQQLMLRWLRQAKSTKKALLRWLWLRKTLIL